MAPLDRIFDAARKANRHILLSEGGDPRIREAAAIAVREGLARITVMDGEAEGAGRIDTRQAPDLDDLIAAYHTLREPKGMTRDRAAQIMQEPIPQAAMRVRMGQFDGTVGGAVHTTSDTVRAALQIIGKAPDAGIVSSFFLMTGGALPQGVIFSDCGMVILPDAQELAAIAQSAARSCRQVLGQEPRIAFLSFSTHGSAEHNSLHKIREAVEATRAALPGVEVDGEMQFDAALDEAIRAKKAPDSPLRGQPNVFIFPNLAAGNIGYKIAQRLGGMTAVGPILQGLALPANDLSRGSTVDDIVATIAVTAVQATR